MDKSVTVSNLKMRRANVHRNESSAHHGHRQGYTQEEWDAWKKGKDEERAKWWEEEEKRKKAAATKPPPKVAIAPSKASYAGHPYVAPASSPVASPSPSPADEVPAGTVAKSRPSSSKNKINEDNNFEGGNNLRAGIVEHVPLFGPSDACPASIKPYQPWDLRCKTQEHLLALQAYAEYLYAGGEVITLPTGIKRARPTNPSTSTRALPLTPKAAPQMKDEPGIEADEDNNFDDNGDMALPVDS